MAFETLSDNMNSNLNKDIANKENTTICHIKVKNKLVAVDIPTDKPGINKTYTFPADEFKRLFEQIYTMSSK